MNKRESADKEKFKVVVRVRPPLERESTSDYASIVAISEDSHSISLLEYLGASQSESERDAEIALCPSVAVYHDFTFDRVYGEDSTQATVYELTAKPAVESVLLGYNATLIAYGQTGTGKTYTMEGFKFMGTDAQRGIVPRAAEAIFSYIQSSNGANTKFMVRVAYLQVYNEVVSDLLRSGRSGLVIREEKRRGVFVEGLSEWAVRCPADLSNLIQRGQSVRATASTRMNDTSSRSHAVFILIVEQLTGTCQIKVGKLNIVDLAGSERVSITGATGQRLEETKKINQSLSALGNVIAALTELKQRTHVPYRDSKLTRLLEDSLGGNCTTTMMATISSAAEAFAETLSTVKFASRAKSIRNAPRVNQDVDEGTLLRKYETELRKLRAALAEKNQHVTDIEGVMKLEKEKKQAEADKEAAVQALEQRSRECLLVKGQMQQLEDRIQTMNSQMIVGGKQIEDTPQFRNALEAKFKHIREQYAHKSAELDRERELIGRSRNYNDLLEKQSGIMTALTAQLCKRDETIVQFQEELQTLEHMHRHTQKTLENNRERNTQLEQFIVIHGLESPEGSAPENSLFLEKISELTVAIEQGEAEIFCLQEKVANDSGKELAEVMEQQIVPRLLKLMEHLHRGADITGMLNGLYKVASQYTTPVTKENLPLNILISGYRNRALTVDEMLMIKRKEMKTKLTS